LTRVPFVTTALAVALLAPACSGDDAEPLAVGACMRPGGDGGEEGADYDPVACDEPEAAVEVVALAPADPRRVGPACPAGTDVALQREDGEEGWDDLCLRRLDGDHPGDAGNGGGELTVGDCAGGADDAVVEVPCPDSDGDGDGDGGGAAAARFRVVGFAAAPQDCPPGTTDPLDRAGGTLCAAAL
jgi:hypothetical protein